MYTLYNRLISNISFAQSVPELSESSEGSSAESSNEFLSKQICQGSVDTELIDRNHRAEKHVKVSSIIVELWRLFAMFFAVQLSSFKCTGCSKKVSDQILYLIGVSSFLQFCSNFRLVHLNSSLPISSLIQVPRMTNDRKETGEHILKLQKNSEYILCVSVFFPYNVIIHWHEDDSAVEYSGSHCILFHQFFESLRGCPTSWILGIFSTRTQSACRRCDSILWSGCSANAFQFHSSKLRLGHISFSLIQSTESEKTETLVVVIW